MKIQIPLNLVDCVVVLSLLPIFLVRLIHWIFDRHILRDNRAREIVDRFSADYANHLSYVEIRPGRTIRVLHVRKRSSDHQRLCIGLIHGACARMQQFANQIEFLVAEGFEVVSYDAVGCGGSPAPVGAAKYVSQEMYLDMLAFVEKFNPACLIGHSMGGAMVHKLAISEEPKIRAAISLCPPAFSGKRSEMSIFKLPISLLWLIRPVLGIKARELLFGPKASEDLRRMEKEASARNPVHMFKSFYMGVDRDFFQHQESKAQIPILLLAADSDRICPPEGVQTYMDSSGRTELVTLKDCGHQCMQEDADQVNGLIFGFLRKIFKL